MRFDSSDIGSTASRFAPEALKANMALVDLLQKLGPATGAAAAQIALALPPTQEPWIVPIPGTTKRHRLDENLGWLAVEFTTADLRAIDEAAAKITLEGPPKAALKMTGDKATSVA